MRSVGPGYHEKRRTRVANRRSGRCRQQGGRNILNNQSELGDSSLVTVLDARSNSAETVKLELFGHPEEGWDREKGADVLLVIPERKQPLIMA